MQSRWKFSPISVSLIPSTSSLIQVMCIWFLMLPFYYHKFFQYMCSLQQCTGKDLCRLQNFLLLDYSFFLQRKVLIISTILNDLVLETWIRWDVSCIPDKRYCIIVWPKTWKTSKQHKLRISDDIVAQKCRTLPSSVQWNKIGKQTSEISESHLIFHLGMELESTPPNGYQSRTISDSHYMGCTQSALFLSPSLLL